jgi:transcriptional regulator with XRE-family HTH domain
MHGNSLTDAERQERERVGQILRDFRRKSSLSLDELAALVGKTRPFLANVEAGRKQLPPAMVPVLAEVLDVSPIVFYKLAPLRVGSAA